MISESQKQGYRSVSFAIGYNLILKDVTELTVPSDLDLKYGRDPYPPYFQFDCNWFRRLDYEGGEGMLVSRLLTEAKVKCMH